MEKVIVHQMRAGAPDKAMLAHLNELDYIKHDFTNLVDVSVDDILDIGDAGQYILPADEGDIKYANQIKDKMIHLGFDQSFILLPCITDDEGHKYIIDYNTYIPKDNELYQTIEEETGVKYAKFTSYSIDEFLSLDLDRTEKCAYKTTTGSGSRGVLLIDPDRINLGMKYRESLTDSDLNSFIEFARKENCNIMIQDLIANDPNLLKINVDFAIREGNLLGYKWDIVNQSQQFTNWDNLTIIRNQFTDKIMKLISSHLVSYGISDALMNFEAFSDMNSVIWLIEFNWRYSNSMFECQAFDCDLVYNYINGIPFAIPFGEYKAIRYWQCMLYEDIPNYKIGI